MIKNRSLICVAFFCIAIGSCNTYGPATGPISSRALIGRWSLTEENRRFLEKHELCCTDPPTTIILSGDGTFQLENIADCWAIDSRQCKGDLTYSGTWRLFDRQDSTDSIWLALTTTTAGSETTHSVQVLQYHDQYFLSFGFGDPDAGRGANLARELSNID